MGNIKTVLLVVNPISGDLDKSHLLDQVKKEVIKIKATLVVFYTQGKKDALDLDKTIKEINPDRIICAGGDCTIKIVAEALNSRKIPVGIIPIGSANCLATNLV